MRNRKTEALVQVCNLTVNIYATLSKSVSQRLNLSSEEKRKGGRLRGGDGGHSSSMQCLFIGSMCVLETVLSTVNTTVNNRDRGLAFLVMLVTLRSEQTIIIV